MGSQETDVDLNRRGLLGGVIKAVMGVVAVAVGGPLIGYVLSPLLAPHESRWNEVGPVDGFRAGQTILTIFPLSVRDGWVQTVRRTPVYVRRDQQDQFAVYSPKCTHLGCMTQWNGNTQQFFCPCHGGVFDAEGKVLAGPPPRPLEQYETKVENGRLFVGALRSTA